MNHGGLEKKKKNFLFGKYIFLLSKAYYADLKI